MSEVTVRLMHYDPRWRQEFQQTRSSVLQSCEGWVTEVEHIGSTAIPGLIARPIIDCIAGVDSDDAIEPSVTSIEGLNFRRCESQAWSAGCVLLAKPRHGESTHMIVIARRDGAVWRRAIGIRDYMARYPEYAVRFEESKVRCWRNGEGDPQQYEQDKSLFFSHLTDQIDAKGTSSSG
jgi:GrpB-like predicted nucleotidyltransferase (UPF0157 family)